MIQLKRLNGVSFYLNAELIEQIERTPDTVITLRTGNNIVVQENINEVIDKIIEYKRQVFSSYADKSRDLMKIKE